MKTAFNKPVFVFPFTNAPAFEAGGHAVSVEQCQAQQLVLSTAELLP